MTLQFSKEALSSDENVRKSGTGHLAVPTLRVVSALITSPVLTTIPVPEPVTALVAIPELQTTPLPPADHHEHLPVAASGQMSCIDRPQPLDPLIFPHQPKPGSSTLPATIDNIEHMLTGYGIKPRYNAIKKRFEANIPGLSGCSDNFGNSSMTIIVSLATVNGIATGRVPEYVAAIADMNTYSPVAEWINSKPWDGKDRLSEVYDTITERPTYPKHLKRILIYRWLLSAVAAALKASGYKGRGVLTLQGEQGIGKTSWLKSLVDNEILKDDVVKVDHHLDVSNKDTVLNAVCHWLVELGELDSSFKKDVSRLKGFLTSDADKIRRPYARVESEYARKTVFFASVNQPDFLVDSTGNTRWWVIPVIKVNFKHTINMQQVFAQLAVDYHNGKEWWLDQHEEALLESCNNEHRSISVIHERLLEIVDMELVGKDGNPAMTASEVLIRMGYTNPSNAKAKECAAILRELFGEHKKIRGINKYRIPLKHVSRFSMVNDLEDDDKY